MSQNQDTLRSEAGAHDALESLILQKPAEIPATSQAKSIGLVNIGEIYRRHILWKERLSRVEGFFAVKSNRSLCISRFMKALGYGFNCSSLSDVQYALELGISPSRIVYTHAFKTEAYLRFAAQHGISLMSVDNLDELKLVKQFYPAANLLIRVKTLHSLGPAHPRYIYGVSVENATQLLQHAKELELNIIGVSFYVGSDDENPYRFASGVERCWRVFDEGLKVGFGMKILDVGGGFSDHLFDKESKALVQAIDQYFPIEDEVKIIGEPGRYFTNYCFYVACQIVGRRPSESLLGYHQAYRLYLSDSWYQNLGMLSPNTPVQPRTFKGEFYRPESLPPYVSACSSREYVICGCSTDPCDTLSRTLICAAELVVGDWIYFPHLGAYTQNPILSSPDDWYGPFCFSDDETAASIWRELIQEKRKP